MSGVVVQAVTGDITKETTDVIVNSSNSSFSLKSGTLTSIYDHTLGNIANNSKHKGRYGLVLD